MSKEMQDILMPKLRFPDFINEIGWKEKRLNELGNLINGLTYSPEDVREEGLLVLRSSNVQNGQLLLEDCVFVRPNITGANLVKSKDILVCIRNGSKALIGKNAIIPKDLPLATHGAFMTIFRANFPEYVFQLFQTDAYSRQVNADLGATINSINGTNFLKYKFAIPQNPKEQRKIADCLSSFDDLITAESEKLGVLKEQKKGLMHQLFPAEGQNSPKLRFSEFLDEEDWAVRELSSILSYERPDPYIVSNTSYQKEGTPVLTANKSFILGYTDEGTGIYQNLPVIIFDDFTIDKKYVDFPFKVKSSAIKILKAKINYNLRFIYELLTLIKFEAKEHKRYYISAYQSLQVLTPTPKEQQKIADCLSSLDEQISVQTQKIENLKTHKKGLMQQLFPNVN